MAARKSKKSPIIEALEGFPCKEVFKGLGIDTKGEPFIHEHLMDDARGCIEVIRDSMPLKVYSRLDSYLLAAFGMAWAMHKMASLKISAPDFQAIYIMPSSGAMVQSGWLAILNKQAMIMASLSDRLGLSPFARNGLKLPGERQQKSKFDGLIAHNTSSPLSSVLPFRQERVRAVRSD